MDSSVWVLNLTFAFVTSLLLGMRHATDSDHIVAVSTIVSRERSLTRAGGIGVLWGAGHTLTIFVVGGAIIAFKTAFTPTVGLSLELTVAVMLIALGTMNVFDIRPRNAALNTARPFIVGVVHGLAGSAGATLLVLPLIADVRWAIVYLAVFGVGTIIGMAIVTVVIAAPTLLIAKRAASIERSLQLAFGAVSVVFGLYLASKIGFSDGLFVGRAVWTPR